MLTSRNKKSSTYMTNITFSTAKTQPKDLGADANTCTANVSPLKGFMATKNLSYFLLVLFDKSLLSRLTLMLSWSFISARNVG